LTAAAGQPVANTASRPLGGGRRLPLDWLGAVPFLAYVGVFLLLPTGIVVVGAFFSNSGPTLANLRDVTQPFIITAAINSLVLSLITAILGAVLGALMAYALATGNPNGALRRLVSSACGVLAQFGGVILAFAFIATIGLGGFVYVFMYNHGIDIYANGVWLYTVPGLILVYMYFQIPLMVLVFLPALDGIKPQWREATESLGGSTWHYWRHVAGPLLAPAFLGATLLLFANAFSAYATVAALINQGGIVLPIQIANALQSETGSHDPGFAKALALVMVVVVAVVMTLYTVLSQRTAKWLQ
jgi:putative spermidine/putrescine transport system permease protein